MISKEELLKFYIAYRLYIFPGVVALSSMILILFVIFPQTMKLLSNQNATKDLTAKTKFLEAKAQTLESYDPQDLNLKVNYALYSLPTDKDFSNAVGLIEDLTGQGGFSVISLTLGALSQGKSTQSYNIKLDILGPTAQLSRFLTSVESAPRIMRISSVETSNSINSQLVPISINIDVLYSSAPQDSGSIDSPLPELSQKDEDVIAKLARVGPQISVVPTEGGTEVQPPTQLSPRGKSNPFE